MTDKHFKSRESAFARMHRLNRLSDSLADFYCSLVIGELFGMFIFAFVIAVWQRSWSGAFALAFLFVACHIGHRLASNWEIRKRNDLQGCLADAGEDAQNQPDTGGAKS